MSKAEEADRRERDQGPPQLLSEESVRRLFSEIQIRRTERGGLSFEASPAAAGTLAALLQGLAGLLGGHTSQR